MHLAATIHLTPDKTFFPMLGIFLFVLAVLTIFVFRPMLRIIDKRRELTEGEMERARNLEHLVDENEAEIRYKFDKAHRAGAELRENMRQNATVTARMLLEEGRSARAEILQRGIKAREEYSIAMTKEIGDRIPEISKAMVRHALMQRGGE